MKTVAETLGNFQLMGQVKGDLVRADRPSVVTDAHFLQPFINKDVPLVKIHGKVPNEVTDADLVAHLKGGGSVEAFVAKYAEPAPKAPAKAAAKA